MVFTTQHDVCFSNYVIDYFRADILHQQSSPFSFVCRSSTTLFWFNNHVPHLETSTLIVIFSPTRSAPHHAFLPHEISTIYFRTPTNMLFSPMRYALLGPESLHFSPCLIAY
ncbi:hypothetical protein F2Q68_00015838 [Brassica cretica]|uniref:Uncharacterized protein n=2 Tax=Brassica cretica TaxID=69181 RepID=A0A8S9HMT0_BRACR|nr:hypothetical protein F2Q68_00015838 [Brassica cretica]KAF3605549.1 hypothetical protein DY000_02048395 [Brassica cretica]